MLFPSRPSPARPLPLVGACSNVTGLVRMLRFRFADSSFSPGLLISIFRDVADWLLRAPQSHCNITASPPKPAVDQPLPATSLTPSLTAHPFRSINLALGQ